ncbi:hypothetical protein FHL15_002259 [Xylaria flabelliformis]|uniref:EamA domain-containing protein n=1 Tax=Xylaria flabelliformis TaxID=2512241 RepID=A0A553I9S1_9PEZI|nr:hypothetical protein FHL15_002259 [Xylaria flabelliformis]
MARRTRKPDSSSSTTSAHPGPSSSATGALKQRRPGVPDSTVSTSEKAAAEVRAPSERAREDNVVVDSMAWTTRNQWIVYAVASGACAAFNGVFAKLTTNDLTAHIADGISRVLGLEGSDRVLEIIVRCIFFGLNLFFNGVMWTLFTQALAKGNSTTQVSIMNTSTNFMITALLGFAIFAEALPPLWWVGATLLVAGNVIIGRKDEGSADDSDGDRSEDDVAESGYAGVLVPELKDEDVDEDVPLIGDLDSPPRDI